MNKLVIISTIVYLFNIPFGYWRANVRKFSWQWILAIHVPVAIVIALRLLTHLGFAWYTYVFMVGAFFLGQQTGSLVLKWLRRECDNITSCLFVDIYRCSRHHSA